MIKVAAAEAPDEFNAFPRRTYQGLYSIVTEGQREH
jgi:hypothetical protein